MSKVKEYVAKQTVSQNELAPLPLMHSCDCFDSRLIIKSNTLEARNCQVFNESLLYFFYGKPSYMVGAKEELNRTDNFYCPVCFIIPLKEIDISRVFPFDSGAFCSGKYNGYMHRHMEISDFELDNTYDGIQQYIKVFYGDNENYIRGNSTINQNNDNPYIQALINLLTPTGRCDIDKRANTIEVITKNCVKLTKSVRCVILPENLIRVNEIKAFFENSNIDYRTYIVEKLTAPSNYNEVVYHIAMEYVKAQKEMKSSVL